MRALTAALGLVGGGRLKIKENAAAVFASQHGIAAPDFVVHLGPQAHIARGAKPVADLRHRRPGPISAEAFIGGQDGFADGGGQFLAPGLRVLALIQVFLPLVL